MAKLILENDIIEYLTVNIKLKKGTHADLAKVLVHYISLSIGFLPEIWKFNHKKYANDIEKKINTLKKTLKLVIEESSYTEEKFKFETNFNATCKRQLGKFANEVRAEIKEPLEKILNILEEIKLEKHFIPSARAIRYFEVHVVADIYEHFTGKKALGGLSGKNEFTALLQYLFELQEIDIDFDNIVQEGMKMRRDNPIFRYSSDTPKIIVAGYKLTSILL